MTASGHRYAGVLLLAPLTLLVGYQADATPVPARHYAVAYIDVDAYDGPTAEKALGVCRDLPGITETGELTSLPPVPQLTFAGTAGQQRAVERCLVALPNARIYGPTEPGQKQAPALDQNWSQSEACAAPRRPKERLFPPGAAPSPQPSVC